MAHTFRQKSQLLQQTGTTINHNHTPGAAATVAVLSIKIESTTARGGGSPTIDGTTATQVGTSQLSAEARHELWYVCKAFSGAEFAVSVPNSGGLVCNIEVVTADAGAGASSVYNSYDEDQGAAGTEDSCVLTAAPNAVGDFMVSSIMSDENAPASVTGAAGTNWDGGFTQLYSDDLGSQSGMSHYSIADATAGTSTVTYSFSNAGYAAHMVVFKSGVAPVEITPPVGSITAAGIASALAFGLVAGAGSAALQGYAPTLEVKAAYEITPPAGSASLAGYQPGQEITITPSGGSFTIAGYGPGTDTGISPASGGLLSDGYAPDVQQSQAPVEITPDPGAVAISGVAPTASVGINVTPPAGIVKIGLFAEEMPEITPDAGNVSVAGYAPRTDVGITPSAGEVALAGSAPTTWVDVSITPPSGSIASTGYASSTDTGIVVPSGAAVVAGVAPTVQEAGPEETQITPDAGSLVAAGYAPTVFAGMNIIPPAGSASVSGSAPTLGKGIVPGTCTASAQGAEPLIAKRIAPSSGSVVVTGYIPQAGSFIIIQPPCGSISTQGVVSKFDKTLAVPSASLSVSGIVSTQDRGITPAVRSVGIAGYAPTVQATANVVVTPASGSVSVAGHAPQIGGIVQIQPSVGSVATQGYAPAQAVGVVNPPGTIVSAGASPALDTGVAPTTGALAAEGLEPVLASSSPTIAPATGHLTFAGHAPGAVDMTVTGERVQFLAGSVSDEIAFTLGVKKTEALALSRKTTFSSSQSLRRRNT